MYQPSAIWLVWTAQEALLLDIDFDEEPCDGDTLSGWEFDSIFESESDLCGEYDAHGEADVHALVVVDDFDVLDSWYFKVIGMFEDDYGFFEVDFADSHRFGLRSLIPGTIEWLAVRCDECVYLGPRSRELRSAVD